MNSKEFEKILHIDNFNLLDTEYTKTKDFFLNLKGQITCKEVSEKFPALKNAWHKSIPRTKTQLRFNVTTHLS